MEVGTQVGGIVQELYADFNSIVKKGQVIARLDPTMLQTKIEQQRANVVRSEADLDRLKVALADSAETRRAKALFDKSCCPGPTRDGGHERAVGGSAAQVGRGGDRPGQVAAEQGRSRPGPHGHHRADRRHRHLARGRTGQTVNAGMSAPTLFVLAADLTKMQVDANIDESEVGRMRPGQARDVPGRCVPNETFTGTVQQVRLQPTTVQNVVTYQTVINVPNRSSS